jgi:ketosteroid isomerase-like protein
VKNGYDHVFNTLKLNVTFTVHEVVEIGDLAYVRTTSAGKTEILAQKRTVKEGNNELFIFRNEDGQWKIHRYLFASTNPTEAK